MHGDHFDWDDGDFAAGNTRHIRTAGFDPEDIEDVILRHRGPIARTARSGRPMIRGATAEGEPIIVVFEIDASEGFVLVRPITAFPEEN